DFIIIKCGLNCRPTPHFHCCYCNSIVIRRDGFIKHLKTCRSMTSRQRPLPTAEPPPSLASAAPPPSPALTAPPLLVSAVPPPSPASTAAPASPVPPPSQASAAPPLFTPSVASPVPPPSQASAALPLLPASLVPPLSPASTAAQPSPVPPPSQASEAASTVPTPPASQRLRARQQVRVTCTHCGISINQRNLQVHINRKHRQRVIEITPKRHHHDQCMITLGNKALLILNLYLLKSFFKPCSPIHVQKQTWGASQKIICELDECNANAEFAVRSGIVPYECIHLRSLLFCPRSDTTPIILEVEVLSEMVASRLFGEARKQSCLNQQKAATDAGVPLSVEVTVGGPASKKLISIYEPKVSYHSRLGRSWHCPCAKARQSCLHKAIAKWHLFKTDRQLFMTAESDVRPDSAVSHQDTQESVCKAKPGEDAGQAYPPDDAGLRRMVHYLMQKKGLPAQLPQHLVTGSRSLQDLPRQLMPKETSCVECAGHLSEPMLITANAKLVTYTGVVDGFSTYCRACPDCGLMYRYQEWSDGIHNFNDHILITLHLCIILRTSLQTHHSVSRAIEVLEQTENKTFPKKATILHAYMHFEALTSHNYSYICFKCGYHPPVVVMDLHRKGVFNMPVSEMEAVPAHFDGTVDIRRFWDSVTSEIICSGLLTSGRKNPFVVVPSYNYWAPWIGPKTRKGDTVLNTEHEKCHAPRQATEMADLQMTEERLQDALINLRVDMVRKLCKQCGLDSKGSKMDLILRLREEMKNRSSYDKIFEKVWGASGGWAVVMCPCGVVYSIKFNLRAESPRDYADMLLSWKHFPNIAIYDFARGLATHTNLREPENLPFSPHEGRLAEATADNLQLAAEGRLKVSLPWLKTKKTETDANGHPITGSSDHYTLYDVFHERNTKDAKDALRRIALVPELAGWVNSQCAEQLFSDMRKNNYFLNTLTPSEHIFMMRNILHHYNTKCNNKTKTSIQKVPSKTLKISSPVALPSNGLQKSISSITEPS
ncbi:hypothetical protein IRJ41_000508, partial [Triplophysa rosa]